MLSEDLLAMEQQCWPGGAVLDAVRVARVERLEVDVLAGQHRVQVGVVRIVGAARHHCEQRGEESQDSQHLRRDPGDIWVYPHTK